MFSAVVSSNPSGPPSTALPPKARVPAWILALAVGVVVLLAATTLDFLLDRRSQSFLANIDASAVTAALLAAVLFYRMLLYERQRRDAIRRRLETVAEMNHHIRNAIHTIVLSSKFPQNEDAVKALNESVQRVDWALKEILPKL
jgi:hypothetical protein